MSDQRTDISDRQADGPAGSGNGGGPYDSVLGRRKDRVVKYMTTNMPQPFDVATGDVRLCGALAEVDETTGRAISIERVEVPGGNAEQAYDADDANPSRHAREAE